MCIQGQNQLVVMQTNELEITHLWQTCKQKQSICEKDLEENHKHCNTLIGLCQ